MKYVAFSTKIKTPIAILIKKRQLSKQPLIDHYIKPSGINEEEFIALGIDCEGKQVKVKEAKDCIANMKSELLALNVDYLLVTDSVYFKVLTKEAKAEPHYGYVLDCKLDGLDHMKVIMCPNYGALFHDPNLQPRVDLALNALGTHMSSSYKAPGEGIIHTKIMPQTTIEIANWLDSLHQYPMLTADIETFDLKFYKAGLGTIGFAWDQHNGGAFCIDRGTTEEESIQRRELLKNFFETYKGKLIWHNAGFDITVIIYQLWMKKLTDLAGLTRGLLHMTKNFDDTKIITYLATNSCAGNELGLKAQAREFAGNYAQDDIKDINKIPIPALLEYNLVDCLSTWFVYNKNYPLMIADDQAKTHNLLFLPALRNIIQMQLTGMPLNMKRVHEVKAEMEEERNSHVDSILSSKPVVTFTHLLRQRHIDTRNATLKKKQIGWDDPEVDKVQFNPGSGVQVQELLYDTLQLPVLDLTDSKQPATGAKTLAKLINHTEDEDIRGLLDSLIKHSKVEKILTAFIPAFLEAPECDGHHYLFGSFNLNN